VVAEHRERRLRQLGDEPPEQRLPARMREQVPRDDDQVGAALTRPGDRALDGADAGRPDAEVEVGEVGDPQAVEHRRQSRHRHVDDAVANPTRLEEPPGETGAQKSSGPTSPEDRRAGIRPSTSHRSRPMEKLAV
jgi:hypothetical protein